MNKNHYLNPALGKLFDGWNMNLFTYLLIIKKGFHLNHHQISHFSSQIHNVL